MWINSMNMYSVYEMLDRNLCRRPGLPCCGHKSQKKDKDRRKGKGRRCCLGDVLVCRTNYLAARMILTKVFGRTSILGGWWFCYGVYRMNIHFFKASIFSKHPFFQSIHLLYSTFTSKSSWWKTSSAAGNWINSIPPIATTTFAYSSVFILLQWHKHRRGECWLFGAPPTAPFMSEQG